MTSRDLLAPIALLAWAWMILAAAAGGTPLAGLEGRLDPATGEIEGETAVVVYPARFVGAKPVEILRPEDCVVRLRSTETRVVHSRPCGEWFLLPSGTYRYFVETQTAGAERISPHPELLVHRARAFDGAARELAVPLGPAGRVTPAEARPAGENESVFGVFQADSHAGGRLHPPLSRRRPVAEAGEGLVMPEGKAVASVRDRSGTISELSRLFEVSAGETITAPTAAPAADRSHLMVQVLRPEHLQTAKQDSVKIRLVDDEERRPPDVRLPFADSVFGIWYDLPPGAVEIVAESAAASLERPLYVELEGGKIATAQGTLVGPTNTGNLDVEVDLPPMLWEDEVRLEVRHRVGDELLAEQVLDPYEQWLRFEDLPAGVLTVEIATSLGEFAEMGDLRPGAEGFVRIAPEVIRVSGRVTSGDEPQAAKLRFVTLMGDDVTAETDEHGHYEITTLEFLRWLYVQLPDERIPALSRLFGTPIAEDRRLDVEIPSNRFEVLVKDELTGEPIEEAGVTAMNEYPSERDPDKPMRDGASSKTDEEGIARLRPLKPGSVEVRAVAEGYEPMDEPVRAQVRAEDGRRELEIRLRPHGARAEVRIRLPDGSPATGARVVLMDASGEGVTSADAGPDGVVELPRSAAGGQAAVTHPRSGFLLAPWQPEEGSEVATWVLPRAAPPLRLRVMDTWGERFVRQAEVGLWIGDTFLSGRLLMSLSGQRPFTDAAGYWSIDNLPAGPVGVVAWKRGSQNAEAAAKLPSMATRLVPPWPSLVEIRAVGE